MARNKRAELAAQRPISNDAEVLARMLKMPSEVRDQLIRAKLTYAMCRQLCHTSGVRQIKGNCRNVLARRLHRLTTFPSNADLCAKLIERGGRHAA